MPSDAANPTADLLRSCARAHLHEAEIARVGELLKTETFDWPAVIRVAGEHGVLPLVHHSLRRADFDSIPPELSQQAQGYSMRNMQLMFELLKLLSAMSNEGIRALAYKGPLLAMFAYGDLSLRQSGDLDILVPEADLAAARALAVKLGYQSTVNMDEKQEAAYFASPHEYDFVYIRPDNGIMIELHWRVAGKMLSFAPDPIDLWQRARLQAVAGSTVRMLTPEDLLLILCAHGTKHFWSRLGWICDLAEFIRAYPALDWQIVMDRAASLESRDMTLLSLVLANRVLSAAVPQHVLNMARRSVNKQAAELDEQLFAERPGDEIPRGGRMELAGGGLFHSLMFHFRTREKWSTGLRYVFHRAFTPNAVDQGAMKLPHRLGFIYYFVRPLRLLAKYGPVRFRSNAKHPEV